MLNDRQMEIVNGSLLGDGTIWTNFIDPLMKWSFSQSKSDSKGCDKASYLCWFAKEFINIGISLRTVTFEATFESKPHEVRQYSKYVFNSRCNKFWNELEAKWYVPRTDHPHFKRRKIVPQDIKLTPLSLCVWHMDDGSNNAKDANIELNSQGFSESEVEFLIRRLDVDLGLKAAKKVGGRKAGQYKIFVGRKSYFAFMDMIKPHIEWDCFRHKTDTSSYNKIDHRGENHSMAKLTEDTARKAFEFREQGKLQKEIAAELGISKAAVSLLLSGNRWSHLGLGARPQQKPRLTHEVREKIRKLLAEGMSQNKVAEQLGIHQSTVSRIKKTAAVAT